MKTLIIKLGLVISCAMIVVGAVAFVQTPAITESKQATITINGPAKLKRRRAAQFRISVDLTGVTEPGTSQPAVLGSYVIPIIFDRTALQFVSASGGDNPSFSTGPSSATNAAGANTSGLVTLVGSQTTTNGASGVVEVATLEFTVIAPAKGFTTISVAPQLAAPGLSLSSPASTDDGLRIPGAGQPATFKVK
jgi:hypothetical protein